jgi:hypothetical protein
MSAPIHASPVAAGTGDVQVLAAGRELELLGFTVAETAGATAGLTLHHGTGNTDPRLFQVSLAANGFHTVWLGPEGLDVPSGVFLDRTSGNMTLTAFWRKVTS